jgi:hypothetical protein
MHQVLGRLSERDRLIVRLLYRHRVLTTQQVSAAAFPSARRAEMRMRDLHEMRVVDRFRPLVATGSAPYHWVLDEVGAYVAAWECGLDLAKSGWRRDRALSVAASPQLGHLLGVNTFFTALMREARERPDCHLAEWLSSAQCAAVHDRPYGARLRPDGYAVWVEGTVRLPFFLEYDCGTERLERLGGEGAPLREGGRGDGALARGQGGRLRTVRAPGAVRVPQRRPGGRGAARLRRPTRLRGDRGAPRGRGARPVRRVRLVELAARAAWQPGPPVPAEPQPTRRSRGDDHPAEAALAAYYGEDDEHPAAAGGGSREAERW